MEGVEFVSEDVKSVKGWVECFVDGVDSVRENVRNIREGLGRVR